MAPIEIYHPGSIYSITIAEGGTFRTKLPKDVVKQDLLSTKEGFVMKGPGEKAGTEEIVTVKAGSAVQLADGVIAVATSK